MSKALLFHGGGPTAVLNSSLSGALELLQEAGVQTDGALCGIAHVLDGRIRTIGRLDGQALEKLSRSPGSALGSGRDHLEPEDYHTIAGTLARLGYEYVIAAGGNGTMDTTVRLAEACRKYGIKVTGIPKTMDNDLSGTDHSPGFISAALYMAASYPAYRLNDRDRKLFEAWNAAYPPDAWECRRAERIRRVQGNANDFAVEACRRAGFAP